MEQHWIKATYYRGGTSKGVFFQKKDLPTQDEKELNKINENSELKQIIDTSLYFTTQELDYNNYQFFYDCSKRVLLEFYWRVVFEP